MLFVSFLPPLEPLLGGSGGVLGTKKGPSWMPKQLKIDAEMHVKSKVILSSIFSDLNHFGEAKSNQNEIKIASKTKVMLKIAESSKTLYFLMFFNDFHGFGPRKFYKNL